MRLYILFLSLALAALANGIAGLQAVDWAVWVFASFFAMLRIKEFLDDARDLLETKENTRRGEWILKAGFFFGTVSWFFWVLAAMRVGDLSEASRYLLIAFLISTLWVIMAAITWHPRKKYVKWLIANSLYIAILFYCSRLDPVERRTCIGLLYIVLLPIGFIDFMISKSHRVLERLQEV